MQCLTAKITVTGLSIKSTSARPCKGQGDFSFHKSTPIQATALFWNQLDGGYIAIAFVEKAIGSRVPRGHYGIHLTAQLTWRLAIFDNGTETSNLRVVSELDHDVVFGRGVGCGNRRDPLASQQPLPNSSNHLNASQEGWLRIAAVFEQLIELQDSELSKKLADGPFVKSFALSCGFILKGEMSVETCASLLRQRIEAIKHDRQLAVDNHPLPVRTATLDTVSRSEETASSVSSEFDEDDLVYEGSTTSSEMTWERNLHRPPPFLRGIGHTLTENISSPSIQAAQVIRDPSPDTSTGSWIFVQNSSPQVTMDNDSPVQVGGAETEENGEPSLDQGQMSDFDMHPGHKVWVWDKDRQRWRRRGRSGQEETDWFPESFA